MELPSRLQEINQPHIDYIQELVNTRGAQFVLHLVGNALKAKSEDKVRTKNPTRRKEMYDESYKITQLARYTMN